MLELGIHVYCNHSRYVESLSMYVMTCSLFAISLIPLTFKDAILSSLAYSHLGGLLFIDLSLYLYIYVYIYIYNVFYLLIYLFIYWGWEGLHHHGERVDEAARALALQEGGACNNN